MFKFMIGLIKLKLAVLFALLVIYLLAVPPEQRSGRLREVGAQTLGEIENLADMGQEALSNGPADIEARQDKHDGAWESHCDGAGTTRPVLPNDFRRELADAVRRLDVVSITERWQAIEFSSTANSRDPGARAALAREAAALAVLFRRHAWHVGGHLVPAHELEDSLTAYSNTVSDRH